MGQNSKYYGIRFDRGSQNFGFHMIARSQLIAGDRRSVFPYDRTRSQNFLRSAIRDPRSSAIIWKPAFPEFCYKSVNLQDCSAHVRYIVQIVPGGEGPGCLSQNLNHPVKQTNVGVALAFDL